MKFSITDWNTGIDWSTEIIGRTMVHSFDQSNGLSVRFFLNQPDGTRWFNTIPEEVQASILEFDLKYKEYSLACLWFISRDKAALDLFLSSHFLVWFILHHAMAKSLDANDVLPLFGVKRKTLLGLDDLPEKKQLIQFFQRLDEQRLLVEMYPKLAEFIRLNGFECEQQCKNDPLTAIEN